MAPPIPIGQFIPPVTGVNRSFIPVANMFDATGNFRQRTISLGKRRRGPDGDDLDNVFDLSKEFPPLRTPAPLAVDVLGIKSLLVIAANTGSDLKKIIEKTEPGSEMALMARSVQTLYNCVEGLIEKAIVPLCGSQGWGGSGGPGPHTPGRPARQAAAPAPPPKPTGERELREAMERADTESVLYDADLGAAVTFNRARLNANLSAGLKAAAVKKATNDNKDAAEAVRVLDDAFSGVVDVDFLGQASATFNNNRKADDPRNGTYCTMPVKLRFADRDSRVFFENTVRNAAGLKATQSFPKQIRGIMKEFMEKVRAENPGLIVMVRPDSRTLRLNAFTKVDGEKSWSRYHEYYPIPIGIMLSNQSPSAAAVAAGGGGGGAGGDSATGDAAAAAAMALGAMGGGQEESMISS